MENKRIVKINKTIFLYLYIFIFSGFCLFAGMRGIYVHRSCLSSMVAFVISIGCIIGLIYFKERILKFPIHKAMFYFIIFLGIALRIAYYVYLSPQQSSDFFQATKFWNYLQENGEYQNYTVLLSEMDDFQKYYSLYPAWGYYMLLTHWIYRLFGCSTAYMVILNLVFNVLSFIVLYFMVREFASEWMAMICVAVAALWPQCILWSSVTSPDHITIFFLLLMGLFYMKYAKKRNEIKRGTSYLLLAICCGAGASIFKPISAFVCVLLLCSEILNMIIGNFSGIRKSLVYGTEIIVLSLLVTWGLPVVLEPALEQYIRTDVQQATGYYLLWGYSVDENGNWDADQSGEAIRECEESETLAIGLEKVNIAVHKTLRENFHLFPRIWKQKFELLFYSETWPVYWSVNNADGTVNQEAADTFSSWTGIWTIWNSLLILLMPFALKRKDAAVSFLSLCWLGYMMYLIAGSGVQTRYRVIVFVFQAVLAICGINELSKKVRKLVLFRKGNGYG